MADTRLFPGADLFELKATHGLPLSFALAEIIVNRGLRVDWCAFVEEARRNRWWDYQTYEQVLHGLIDADVPRALREEIRQRLMLYILKTGE